MVNSRIDMAPNKKPKIVYYAIFPWVMCEEKYSTPDADLIPAGTMGHWPIKGASSGMAILACILGMPSIMYTGYIKSAGPKNLVRRCNPTV